MAKKMTVKQQNAQKIFERVRGRIRRLEKAGLEVPLLSIGDYITPSGKFSTSVKGLSQAELTTKMRKANEFLSAKTTTVSGARAEKERQRKYAESYLGELSKEDFEKLLESGTLSQLIYEYGFYNVRDEYLAIGKGTQRQRFVAVEQKLRNEMYGTERGHKIYYPKKEN